MTPGATVPVLAAWQPALGYGYIDNEGNFVQSGVEWANLSGAPFITVTPNGPSDGGNFGPNTPGTKTSGLQEAWNAIQLTGGSIIIAQGDFFLSTPLTLTGNSVGNAAQISGPRYSVRGSGHATRLIPTANIDVILLVSNNQRLEGLSMGDFTIYDQNTVMTSTAGMHVNLSSGTSASLWRSFFSNIRMVNTYNGFFSDSVASPNTANGFSSNFWASLWCVNVRNQSCVFDSQFDDVLVGINVNCVNLPANQQSNPIVKFSGAGVGSGTFIYGLKILGSNVSGQLTGTLLLVNNVIDLYFVSPLLNVTGANQASFIITGACDRLTVTSGTFAMSGTIQGQFGVQWATGNVSTSGTHYFTDCKFVNVENPLSAPSTNTNDSSVKVVTGGIVAATTTRFDGFPSIAGTTFVNGKFYNVKNISDIGGGGSNGITTPAVPASGTAQINNFPLSVRVYFLTETVVGTMAFTVTDEIGVVGPSIIPAGTGFACILRPGEAITPTYTTLTWKWEPF